MSGAWAHRRCCSGSQCPRPSGRGGSSPRERAQQLDVLVQQLCAMSAKTCRCHVVKPGILLAGDLDVEGLRDRCELLDIGLTFCRLCLRTGQVNIFLLDLNGLTRFPFGLAASHRPAPRRQHCARIEHAALFERTTLATSGYVGDKLGAQRVDLDPNKCRSKDAHNRSRSPASQRVPTANDRWVSNFRPVLSRGRCKKSRIASRLLARAVPRAAAQADKMRSIQVIADAAKQPKVTLGMDELRREQKQTLPHLRLAVSVEDHSPAPA